MNKADLILALKNRTGLSEPEAFAAVNLFFDEISNSLIRGDRVEIRGLFTFFVKEYDGYIGRNPKTGKRVKVKPKKLPFFKLSNKFNERLNRLK